jgi:glycine cleavage system H protein
MNFPKELKYHPEHTWAKVEGNKVRVGISDFAQNQLGDIMFVELPEVGEEVTAGVPFGSVESAKSINDLFAPVSGKVVEMHEEPTDEPDMVNKDPYGEGWMIVIDMSDPSELDDLLDAPTYIDKHTDADE